MYFFYPSNRPELCNTKLQLFLYPHSMLQALSRSNGDLQASAVKIGAGMRKIAAYSVRTLYQRSGYGIELFGVAFCRLSARCAGTHVEYFFRNLISLQKYVFDNQWYK